MRGWGWQGVKGHRGGVVCWARYAMGGASLLHGNLLGPRVVLGGGLCLLLREEFSVYVLRF